MEGNLRKYLSLLFLSIGCLLGEANAQESSLTLTERRGEVVSQAVHEAITLMANTIEDLNTRLTFLENIILNSGLQGHTIDRVGSAGDPPTTTIRPPAVPPHFSSGEPCSSVNFTRVGEVCYHASAWKNHRAIWEEASKACEKMGAKLAEPTDGSSFIDITQYLSLETSTTGYSYWIGGLYPGISWLWSYSGTMVTLSPSYWTGINAATGNRVAPGDTAPGRCLSFSYLQGASSYFFAADKCGFEKYYLCELLEKSHRML